MSTLGIGVLWLRTLPTALAEPPARLVYIKEATGECGEHQTGDVSSLTDATHRAVLDRQFVEFRVPTSKAECSQLLTRIQAHRAEDKGEHDPCATLRSVLPVGVAQTCEALGYTYVGRLEAKTKPCYPRLGTLLGSSCAPEIWLRAAILLAAMLTASLVALQVLRRRRRNRIHGT